MQTIRHQTAMWRGDFGNDYIERNRATEERIRTRVRAYGEILAHTAGSPPQSILECGCNIGLNLRALRHLTGATLMAIEPNSRARQIAADDAVLAAEHLYDATLARLPLQDASVDLVFTSGVLIHVPPDDLERAYHEMYRVSSRYLLTIEYFSPKPEVIPYRGQDDLLFKRDFGGTWLDLYPSLEPLAQGFFWKRTTGMDDVTWWLFRK